MSRLALDERATMIRSLASLDMPIGYPFAQTIAYGRVPARVPVSVAENAIRAQRLWDRVIDSYRKPLDVKQVGEYARMAHVAVDPDDFTGDFDSIIRRGWGVSPLLASICASHRLMASDKGIFDPAAMPTADIRRYCIRRPEDGLTDEERKRMLNA